MEQLSLFEKEPVKYFPCGCPEVFRWDGKFVSARCKHGWNAFYPHSRFSSEEEWNRHEEMLLLRV